MDNTTIQNIKDGLSSAFIEDYNYSNLAYKPELLTNNYLKGQKVLSAIERELTSCDEFSISVAFITESGIVSLLQTLKELEERGVRGRILTTDYLCFSEPRALDKLATLKNIELKMYLAEGAPGFHTKGYIFEKEGVYRIIIGSSNMTQSALTVNQEWNTKIVSTDRGEFAKKICQEFDFLWNDNHSKEYEQFIEDYKLKYSIVRKQRKLAAELEPLDLEAYRLQPNSMQRAFIANFQTILAGGAEKALLISATGTGKTYASAFAMREVDCKKILFLVHRNQIAKQAKKSYERVFGKTRTTGLVTGIAGKDEDYKADLVFATVQTLSKDENLKRFPIDYFDACIFDEAHHASAKSFKKVMDYFHPKFTLGMTATPDKRDDNIEGRNIYEIFDHNIAYEIRLQQAMEEDLLCPFHYFGITDLNTISDEGTTKAEKLEHFRYLTSDERVKYILENADYYGYSGDRVKGLIFCSRVDEAKELEKKLNKKGRKTKALSGADSEAEREKAIELLTKDVRLNEDGTIAYGEDYLEYIITVDVFSEGTDIVEVNQVIMLRPTQSPIVFVQQLGRGLRKSEGKEYVVVLDFIGNYKNNYMIPIALSGDRSYNKDNVRRYLVEGNRIIPGASTVHFDEISRKRIFESIDSANFSEIKLLRENYQNLKDKLGRIPKLSDFDDYGEMDVFRIIDNSNLGSYYKFLEKYEDDYSIRLSDEEQIIIKLVSKKFAPGKRVHELLLLKRILMYSRGLQKAGLIEGMKADLTNRYNITLDELAQENVINVMTNEFATGSAKITYKDCVFIEKDNSRDGNYITSKRLSKMLLNDDFYNMLCELVDFGINRYEKYYASRYKDTDLVLYRKYTYEDACRLLRWEHEVVSQNIGGYKYDSKTKTFPVFINYEKAADISDSIKYEDHFDSNDRLKAISKSGRKPSSKEVQTFLKSEELGINVELFVRKNKDDKISKEFYYLGRMHPTGETESFTMPNTNKSAVKIGWILDEPVREDIYEYIVNG